MKPGPALLALGVGTLVGLDAFLLVRGKALKEDLAATQLQIDSLVAEVTALRNGGSPPGGPGFGGTRFGPGGPQGRPGRFGGPGTGTGTDDESAGADVAPDAAAPGPGRDRPAPPDGRPREGQAAARAEALDRLVADFARDHDLGEKQRSQARDILDRMAEARAKAMREARASGQPPTRGTELESPGEKALRDELVKLLGQQKADALLKARMDQIRQSRGGRGGARSGRPGPVGG